MSELIKVLLADDSSVVRRLLSSVLEKDPLIKVVKHARHGAEAVGAFPQCRPDVVILDVEMPQMDGVEAAAAIRELDATVPILMFSSLTTAGGEATLDALLAGATDYVTKPSGTGSVSESIKHMQTQLIPKVHLWVKKRQGSEGQVPAVATNTNPSRRVTSPVQVMAIGASAGGPDALSTFFKELPADFPIPIVIAQHMPRLFTGLLAERLNKVGPLEVREAVDAKELRRGAAWIAPGDSHLEVVNNGAGGAKLSIGRNPALSSCGPSVDVLFRSVANCFGSGTLAVVLTGMGNDGLSGCETVRNRGGRIFVQDEPSSVVWSMPGVVASAGLADGVMPPTEIAREVIRLSATKQLANAK